MQINMCKEILWSIIFLAFAIFLTPFSNSAAATGDNIGQIIFMTGSLQAVNDNDVRDLTKGSQIYEGDVLKSSENSQSQIRMKDGALIALRPKTEFGFEQYQFDEVEAGSDNSSILNLIKGGFRTITGLIGKSNKENYKVNTIVATIGIRGTTYGGTIDKGSLYVSVIDGAVSAKNNAGEFTFRNDEFFRIDSQDHAAQRLIAPPGNIFGQQKQTSKPVEATSDEEVASGGNTNIGQEANIENALVTANELLDSSGLSNNESDVEASADIDLEQLHDDLITPTPTPNTENIAEAGYVMAASFFLQGSSSEIVIAGATKMVTSDGTEANQIILEEGETNVALAMRSGEFSLSTTAVVEPNNLDPNKYSDVVSGIGWGRWSDAYSLTAEGTAVNHVGQLHYLVSAETTSFDKLGELEGSYSYHSVGGTLPTDLNGITAESYANVDMEVNFNSMVVQTLAITTTINEVSYIGLVGDVTIGENTVFTGEVSEGSTGPMQASMSFYGENAEGAGIVFTIRNIEEGNAANGAAVMTQQPFPPRQLTLSSGMLRR